MYDLIDLRAKLRRALNVDQISFGEIVKKTGVTPTRLGAFLADGPLDDQQAMYLHSYLYFDEREHEETVRKLTEAPRFVGPWPRFWALWRELSREYDIVWTVPREFFRDALPRRKMEYKRMEDRAKAELLRKHEWLIRQLHIKLQDGQSYWQWRDRIRAYKDRQEAGGRGLRSPETWAGRESERRLKPDYVRRSRGFSWRSG